MERERVVDERWERGEGGDVIQRTKGRWQQGCGG